MNTQKHYDKYKQQTCKFYNSTGCCRYGEQCKNAHPTPLISRTLLIPHMYQPLPIGIALAEGMSLSDSQLMEIITHQEQFYMEVFMELCNYGEIVEMRIVDNITDHLIGNVYVLFYGEEDAKRCMEEVRGKKYKERLVVPEYSPIVHFQDGECKQFLEDRCTRGGNCNLFHFKEINKRLRRKLMKYMYK